MQVTTASLFAGGIFSEPFVKALAYRAFASSVLSVVVMAAVSFPEL
jgi:hypothetical protein